MDQIINGLLNKMNPFKSSYPSAIKQKTLTALLTYVIKQMPVGLLGSLFCASILLVALDEPETRYELIGWYGVFWLVILFRYLTIQFYRFDKHLDENTYIWSNLITAGVYLTGLCWSYLTVTLLPYKEMTQLTMLILIIAGMTAASIPVLSGILRASIGFIVITLLPLIIRLFYTDDAAYMVFDFALFCYLWFLIIISIQTNKTLSQAIELQFENHALLADLSIAKEKLESINKQLEHAATHDSLTNLANRDAFEINFKKMLVQAEKNQKILALFYLDIDRFKAVNDAYGHYIGDLLLQNLVERLRNRLSDNIFAARLGGDEITIIINNIDNPDKIAELAAELCAALAKPFHLKDYHLQVSACIGVSIYPIDGRDYDSLLKKADKAMYYAKEHGGNTYHFNTDISTIKASLPIFFPKVV